MNHLDIYKNPVESYPIFFNLWAKSGHFYPNLDRSGDLIGFYEFSNNNGEQIVDKIDKYLNSMENKDNIGLGIMKDIIREADLQKIKIEIKDLWVELGRDLNKINLDNKTDEELADALEKLKAIKMGFDLLFREGGNHKLAIHLLAKVFLTDEENEEN